MSRDQWRRVSGGRVSEESLRVLTPLHRASRPASRPDRVVSASRPPRGPCELIPPALTSCAAIALLWALANLPHAFYGLAALLGATVTLEILASDVSRSGRRIAGPGFVLVVAAFVLYGPAAAVLLGFLGGSVRVLVPRVLTLGQAACAVALATIGPLIAGFTAAGAHALIPGAAVSSAIYILCAYIMEVGVAPGLLARVSRPSLSHAWAHQVGWKMLCFAAFGALGAWLGHDLAAGRWIELLYFAAPLVLLRQVSGDFFARSENYVASVENENSALFDKIGQLDRFNGDLVEALSMAIDSHSGCDAGKSRRIAQIAVSIGSALGISGPRLEVLRRGALLHDVGYLAIPSHIVDQPGRLSASEYNQMRLHCEFGARLVGKWRECRTMAQIIEQHHEHFDGKGYPRGLKGDEIILEARIVAVADAYASMMSDRPHRNAVSHAETIAEIGACAGTQFDPVVVEAMIQTVQYRAADILPLKRHAR